MAFFGVCDEKFRPTIVKRGGFPGFQKLTRWEDVIRFDYFLSRSFFRRVLFSNQR